MKIAPIIEALRPIAGIRQLLVNTGQHYDESMAGGFFKELDLPRPDRDLGVGSGQPRRPDREGHDRVRGGLPRRDGPISSSSSATSTRRWRRRWWRRSW